MALPIPMMSMSPCSVCSPPSGFSPQSPSSPVLSATPGSRVSANLLADNLGVSPLYRQLDAQRWALAYQLYVRGIPSTENGSPDSDSIAPPRFPSYDEIAALNRKRYAILARGEKTGCSDELVRSALQLEATAAVHELRELFEDLYVSEMLPRTADLIFVNVKTIDGHPFTLELTLKGWRIASLHTDSMNGDYRRLGLHVNYYDSIRAVVPVIERLEYDNMMPVTGLRGRPLVAVGSGGQKFFSDESQVHAPTNMIRAS